MEEVPVGLSEALGDDEKDCDGVAVADGDVESLGDNEYVIVGVDDVEGLDDHDTERDAL